MAKRSVPGSPRKGAAAIRDGTIEEGKDLSSAERTRDVPDPARGEKEKETGEEKGGRKTASKKSPSNLPFRTVGGKDRKNSPIRREPSSW